MSMIEDAVRAKARTKFNEELAHWECEVLKELHLPDSTLKNNIARLLKSIAKEVHKDRIESVELEAIESYINKTLNTSQIFR